MNSYIKIVPVLLILIGASSCGQNNNRQVPENNNVTITNNNVQGFNINGLSDLVKKSTDPDALEKAINSPNNNINNLDLDEDGKVDFVKVQESGKNEFKLVDDVSDTQSVTVATVTITPNADNNGSGGNNTANLSIQGNPVYSGPNYYYHSSFSFTDLLIMSYLLRPHPYYMPMYHYGYYPRYYTTTRTVVTRPLYRPSTATRGAQYNNRSSLSSPSRSQRSFSSSPSSGSRSSGFGSSPSSGRSGFGSSPSRSFGSGGGGRRSSGFGRRR